MGQVILVGSYCGLSSYIFDVKVEGRLLTMSEVRRLGLVDENAIRRHSSSDYSYEWYEISPGDQITITAGELGDEEEMILEVPTEPLPQPPQRLDDVIPNGLIKYLRNYCKRIK